MVANWIEQARELGIANARNSEKPLVSPHRRGQRQPVSHEKHTESFHRESVTPAEISEFLNSYMAPVLALLYDLRTYSSDHENLDFIVEEPKDDFYYMGDVDNTGGNSYREQYALTKVQASYRGATDYRVDENFAFGRACVVNHWTKQYLSSVRLFPRTNSATHYAGVEYQVDGTSKVITASENPMDVLPYLQTAIAACYTLYIEKQAKYFEW